MFDVHIRKDDVEEDHAGVKCVGCIVPPCAEVGAMTIHLVQRFDGENGGSDTGSDVRCKCIGGYCGGVGT